MKQMLKADLIQGIKELNCRLKHSSCYYAALAHKAKVRSDRGIYLEKSYSYQYVVNFIQVHFRSLI